MNTEKDDSIRDFTDEELALKDEVIKSKSVDTGINLAELLDSRGEQTPAVYYIELNNWFCGRDYPIDGKLKEYVENHNFSNDEWCKENKLCVLDGNVDMSINWCITAPADWVEENCPELLGNKEYTYEVHVYSRGEKKVNIHKKKYCDFLRPEEDDAASSRFGVSFLEYSEENFGVTSCEYDW